jgi:hypothetical protein
MAAHKTIELGEEAGDLWFGASANGEFELVLDGEVEGIYPSLAKAIDHGMALDPDSSKNWEVRSVFAPEVA